MLLLCFSVLNFSILFVRLLNAVGHFPVSGFKSDPDKRYTSLLCACTNPLSRGTVHVSSTDPFIPPTIDQNYLSNPADLEILTHFVKFTMKLFRTEPLSEVVLSTVAPNLKEREVDDNEAILNAYARSTLGTVYHPIATASMLPLEDGGVVDSQLKVYGTSNLRIVRCLLRV